MITDVSRRVFLRRASALSLTGVAAPWALNLSAIGEAAAADATDYKALVCVFLSGGNDYANTLVTYDAPSHALYTAQRPAIATARADLAATLLNPDVALPDGRQYALAPQLAPLLPLFDQGRLAVMMNIGTLVEPVTKDRYTRGVAKLPPKLFSHNDQVSYYQSEGPEGNVTGWGGRMGDLYAAGNGNAVFTCISASGSAVFLSGDSAVAYQVSPKGSGAVAINGIKNPLFGSAACSAALRDIVTAPRSHLFEAAHAEIVRRSIDAEALLAPALPAPSKLFPAGNSLAAQLSMVARIIGARSALGPKRQVFFVALGGFDTHDAILADHGPLLTQVAEALAAFHAATVEMGVEDKVTAFTASDFGRTLNSDGDGSDHGWGSMHFVLGGANAVNGRHLYGTAPVPANDGPNDVGRGRLIPTTSVDQFGASLARWFGVADSELDTVFPNLHNFGSRTLPFMKFT